MDLFDIIIVNADKPTWCGGEGAARVCPSPHPRTRTSWAPLSPVSCASPNLGAPHPPPLRYDEKRPFRSLNASTGKIRWVPVTEIQKSRVYHGCAGSKRTSKAQEQSAGVWMDMDMDICPYPIGPFSLCALSAHPWHGRMSCLVW